MTELLRRSRFAPFEGTLAAAIALLALTGCPGGDSGAPPATCRNAYDKCTLRQGVLGICDTVPCAEGQPEPCLVCRSQH